MILEIIIFLRAVIPQIHSGFCVVVVVVLTVLIALITCSFNISQIGSPLCTVSNNIEEMTYFML